MMSLRRDEGRLRSANTRVKIYKIQFLNLIQLPSVFKIEIPDASFSKTTMEIER